MDFKNVQDPYITSGYADFRFMGALGSERLPFCDNFDPEYMWWYGDHVESQLVVSEAAANCFAE